MKIKINLFPAELINAIGAGIYEITVESSGISTPIYIGESVFVLVRCATHLFELNKNPGYFGFTDETIEYPNITLSFKLINQENNSKIRKDTEKQLIKERKPICQSCVSDRMKGVDEKIEALTQFLNLQNT